MNGNPTTQESACTIAGKVCPECPFSRTVKPGALGGSDPMVYISQAAGPFLLPCHMHCDFEDPSWRSLARLMKTPQCRGAATFRANLGIDFDVPAVFPIAPVDHATVFSTPQEFLRHHTGKEQAADIDLRALVLHEMHKPQAQVKVLPK